MTLEGAMEFCKNNPDMAATIILEIEALLPNQLIF